jgi:hypothetical protein
MTNPFIDEADRQDRNRAFIPNYGEHISASFVESTVHQVISKRFCKSSRCSGPNAGCICWCKPSIRNSVWYYCGAREGRAGCCTSRTNSCNSLMFRFETTQ